MASVTDAFCLSLIYEGVTKHYLSKQYDYLTDTKSVPLIEYGYPYKPGIFVASRGTVYDTNFDLFSLVYTPTKQIADRIGITISAARSLQKHIQFDMPISFTTYLKILKHYGRDKLDFFYELPDLTLMAKL